MSNSISRRFEPSSSSDRFATAVLLGLVIVAVVLSALSFQRKMSSFHPVGLELASTSAGWRVEAAYSASSLLPGDILVLIDKRDFSSQAEATDLLERSHTSDVVFLRDGELQTGIHRRPPLRIDFSYLVLALIGVAYLFIGLYTLLRGVDWQVALFVLWCTCSALLYLISPNIPPADALDLLFYLLDESCRLLLPPLTLHFFLVFPRPLREQAPRIQRHRVPFLYLPGLALLALQTDLALGFRRLVPSPSGELVFLLDRISLLLVVGYSLAALVALIAQGRRSTGWAEQRQILWIAAGMAAGYIPFLGLYVAPLSVGLPIPEALQVLGVLPLALVPLGFAWALLRYRLWDVAIILRNATTYTLTLMLGGIGFSLLSLLIRQQVPQSMEWTRNLSTIAGGLLVAGLLVPAKQSIGGALERFQYRGAFARRRALADLGEELLHERDLERLCANLTRQLEETMSLERCNLFLLQDDEFHPVTPESLTASFFLPQEAIGERFWQLDWIRIEQQSLPTLDPDIEDELFSYGYRTAFPLRVRDRPVGILATGYKAGHLPLTSADSDLIRQILNQAALAIENAQLIEQMQQRLRQVLELKQFNEEIIESSPAGIAVLDRDGRIIRANLAFAALVQRNREALRHQPIDDVMGDLELPPPEGGQVEAILVDARGRERNVQLSVAVLRGASGSGDRVLVVNDVTALVSMERALQEKERMAALGVMAAGVAHEVNTPLTGISSYAQMLLRSTEEADPRFALLQKVERQTFRASSIVGSLLELSRSAQPSITEVRMRPLFEESIDLLETRLDEHNVTVDLGDWSESITALGNEGELLQVVNNLIVNAAEAMAVNDSATAREIIIRAEEAEDRIIITVDDRGPGIAPENLPKIFRPFFSTKLDHGGTGLGLSISYEILRRHGGELRATNLPGGGCRMTLILPAKGAQKTALRDRANRSASVDTNDNETHDA